MRPTCLRQGPWELLYGTLDDGVHTRALDNSNTSRELTQAVMPMARMPGIDPSLGAGKYQPFRGKGREMGVETVVLSFTATSLELGV